MRTIIAFELYEGIDDLVHVLVVECFVDDFAYFYEFSDVGEQLMLFHGILYEGNLILSHYFLDEFLILGTTVGKGFYVAVLLF